MFRLNAGFRTFLEKGFQTFVSEAFDHVRPVYDQYSIYHSYYEYMVAVLGHQCNMVNMLRHSCRVVFHGTDALQETGWLRIHQLASCF